MTVVTVFGMVRICWRIALALKTSPEAGRVDRRL